MGDFDTFNNTGYKIIWTLCFIGLRTDFLRSLITSKLYFFYQKIDVCFTGLFFKKQFSILVFCNAGYLENHRKASEGPKRFPHMKSFSIFLVCALLWRPLLFVSFFDAPELSKIIPPKILQNCKVSQLLGVRLTWISRALRSMGTWIRVSHWSKNFLCFKFRGWPKGPSLEIFRHYATFFRLFPKLLRFSAETASCCEH